MIVRVDVLFVIHRRGLSCFFRKRIHGGDTSDNMPELVKPESEWERTESVREWILRWADDGGQMLDIRNPVSVPDWCRT